LQAGRLVFSERGYDGATFQAIAARADLTRPAINHYFSSKRALYREVLEDTNRSIIGVGMERAEGETTLVARLTAFILAAVKANTENPGGADFIITGVLESQRHPELSGTKNDSVRMGREFLTNVVNDAIERREIATDVDVSALIESLVVILCGVGLYAGYVESSQQMLTITETLRQLLEGVFWRPEG
jgi:AcrR family transcriptional regulator